MAQKLIKVAKEFNVGLHTIVETLHSKGFVSVEEKPTTDISDEMLVVLQQEFQKTLAIKQTTVQAPATPASPRPTLFPNRGNRGGRRDDNRGGQVSNRGGRRDDDRNKRQEMLRHLSENRTQSSQTFDNETIEIQKNKLPDEINSKKGEDQITQNEQFKQSSPSSKSSLASIETNQLIKANLTPDVNLPRIFIGSSSEGLDLAEAIHGNLEPRYAEVTVWTQDVFKLSEYILPSLVKKLKKSNYAIFVFKPDDVTKMRNEEFKTVRDNVVFELGLAMGILGIENVFLLAPFGEEDIHLPTDLLGLTVGKYNGNRSDGNLKSATNPFCLEVRQKIKEKN